jgi:hypothetical protein
VDKTTYDKFWEQSIKPQIDRMLSDDDDIFYIEGQIKEKIWLTYEQYKNTVHTYMHNPDGRIDRHKVASVMLYSIIINNPFELKLLPLKQEVKGSSRLANEILGFNTALSIVFSFLIQDANEKSDKIRIEIFRNGFIFPECQHEDYPTHVYKMLYYAKYNNKYDIFAFSHILFLIEAYTELKRKTELAGRVL